MRSIIRWKHTDVPEKPFVPIFKVENESKKETINNQSCRLSLSGFLPGFSIDPENRNDISPEMYVNLFLNTRRYNSEIHSHFCEILEFNVKYLTYFLCHRYLESIVTTYKMG